MSVKNGIKYGFGITVGAFLAKCAIAALDGVVMGLKNVKEENSNKEEKTDE